MPKEAFIDSPHCQSRAHCQACRDLNGGRAWRQAIGRTYPLPNGNADFVCPWGVPWNHEQKRPRPTLKKVATFIEALMTAGKVSDEVRLERMTTCNNCDLLKTDKKGPWCGACGCRVSADVRMIDNLVAYNEGPIGKDNKPQWGCRHPQRATNGKGWRR